MSPSLINIPADIQRQIRIGLVLYGGVALAIYIYGVAVEFLRLVRASEGVEENAYTSLLKRAKAKATIDIISGTSAGGINGVALAKALTQGLGMEALRSAWVHEVDLARLMNPPWRTGARSLLDERAMEKVVTGALDDMEKGPRTEPLVDVMDLHVSSTDLHGRPGVFRDFLGSRVRTREHGKVFRFRFRTKGYNPVDRDLGYKHDDFGPKRNPLLALICRATSAFPLAFRPLELVRGEQTDQLFEPGDGQVAYYSDGGILDNKPFTAAIKAIFSRAASHKVDRVLFFVEPDPRTPAEEEKETRPAEPGPLQVLLKAASAIPRHDSIAADLEAARDRGRRIREFVPSSTDWSPLSTSGTFPR